MSERVEILHFHPGSPLLLSMLPAGIRERVEVGPSCWEWRGSRNPAGYGTVEWEGRSRPVYRVVYEHLLGDCLPRGIDVDHLCQNPGCVNPAHLEAVTHQENIRRGRAATKTRCKHGHDWTEPGAVYVRPDGRRFCAVCCRARVARRAARLRAEKST